MYLILSEPVNLTYVGFSGLTFQTEYYSPGADCCMYGGVLCFFTMLI